MGLVYDKVTRLSSSDQRNNLGIISLDNRVVREYNDWVT